MKPFAGYEAASVQQSQPQLPIGGYVCKIMGAEEVVYDWGRKLNISIDISEGDHKDHYAANYRGQIEPKKWKGTMSLTIPGDPSAANADPEKIGQTANIFKTAMAAIEASNSGYKWDWNEKALKGKAVGALFRNREWEQEGRTGFYTECFKLLPVEDVRAKKYRMPKDKLLPRNNNLNGDTYNQYSPPGFTEVAPTTGDLPF